MKKMVSLFLAVIMAMSVFASVVFADIDSWEGSYGYYNFDDEGNVIITNYAIKDEYEKFLEYVGEGYEVKTITLQWIGFIEGEVFAASSDTLEKVEFDIHAYEIGYNVFGENHNVDVYYEGNESRWNTISKENSNEYFGDISFCSRGNVLISGTDFSAYGDKVNGSLYFYFVEEDCVAELCVYNENYELEVTYPIDVYAGSTTCDFSFDLESDGQYHDVEITLYNNLTDRIQLLDTRYFGFYAEDIEFAYDYMNVNTDDFKVNLDLYFNYVASDTLAVVEIYDVDDNYDTTLNTSYTYEIPAGTTHFSEVLPFEFDNKNHRLQVTFYNDSNLDESLYGDYVDFWATISDGYFMFLFNDDGTLRVSEYTGYYPYAEVPSEVSGYKVTEIGENVFADNTEIDTIHIPATITKIGDGAFSGCTRLKEVQYPESEEDWAKITIGENNDELLNADIVCDYFEISVWFYTNYGADDHQVRVEFMGCTRDCVVGLDLHNISANEVTTLYFDVEAGTTTKTFDVPLTDYDETFQMYGAVMSADKATYYAVPRQFAYFTPYETEEYIVDEERNLAYYINEDNEAIIRGRVRRNDDAKIVIPDTLGGYPVTTLMGWSLESTNASEIVLGKYVRDIGYGALAYNMNLSNIVVGENPYFVFENGVLYNKDKTELILYCLTNEATHFNMPDTVEVIGAHSFEGHEKLKTITVSDNLKSIERQAFAYSSIGGELVLPEGLESIGYEGLVAQFTKVYLPSTVNKIAIDALYTYNGKLTDITVDEDNQTYTSVDGVLFNKDMTKLIRYPEAKKESTYAIPDGVTELDMLAFDSVSLKALYIPKSLKMINCYSLATEFSVIMYEGTEGEFGKITGTETIFDFVELICNAGKKGAMLINADSRYCEGKLTVKADVKYMFDEGTAIVGVYDEDGVMVNLKTISIDAQTTDIKCEFDADEASLGYTVKIMYWGKNGSALPVADVVTTGVKKAVVIDRVIESAHPHGIYEEYSYCYDGEGECESLEITFSEDTYFRNANIGISTYNSYRNYTDDELSGKTIKISGDFFSIILNGWIENTEDYGFKIDKIVANLR